MRQLEQADLSPLSLHDVKFAQQRHAPLGSYENVSSVFLRSSRLDKTLRKIALPVATWSRRDRVLE